MLAKNGQKTMVDNLKPPAAVTIIGCGPGAADLITLRGSNAIRRADLIAGSARLVETFTAESSAEKIITNKNYSELFARLAATQGETKVVLLVSGDPLFSSLGALAIKKLGKENCEVIGGIGSFQQAFINLKEPWTNYNIISLHGKAYHNIEKIFADNAAFALLLDPKRNLKYIKEAIGEAVGSRYLYTVATNLSLPDEEVTELSYDELGTHPEQSLSILIIKKKPPEPLKGEASIE